MIECGAPPRLVGYFEQPSREMMFYLYLPIKFPQSLVAMPKRLLPFSEIVDAAMSDHGDWHDLYCYLTVKTMFVTPACPGNRPGWHIDGFGSGGDVNYTWANINPTEFAVQDFHNIPDDDALSMKEITAQIDPLAIMTWPNNSLLRLDESVVHRVSPEPTDGLRSFVKVTFSRHQFRNEGNSHNHLFDYEWDMIPRNKTRNLDHG